MNFTRLLEIAAQEVEKVVHGLPRALRTEAAHLPVRYEPRPNPHLVHEGIDPETLGLFTGIPFPASDSATCPEPTEVILFLSNLWDEAREKEHRYRKEVRKTYLHELGHYLGLDEEDLEDRQLD